MKTLLAILLLFITISAWSQQQLATVKQPVSCAANYQAAQDAFDVGNFEQVIALLTSCSEGELSANERINILLLLCKTYYYERDTENAEEQARQIFRMDPEYQPGASEQIGVQAIFEKITPKVQQSFSFLVGVNFAFPNTTTGSNYEGNPLFQTTTEGSSQPGFDAELVWQYYTDLRINPLVAISYSQLRFKRTSVNRSNVFNSIQAEAEESDHTLKFNAGASYTLKKKFLGFTPLFELGATYQMFLSSKVSVNTNYIRQDQVPVNTPELNFSDNRKNSFGIFITVGGLKKVHGGNLMFKLQYYKGITSQVNTTQVLRHQELIFNSYYFDNDFKMNTVKLAVGFERFYFKYR